MIKIPLGNKLIYIFTAARTGVCAWYGRYPPALWYDFGMTDTCAPACARRRISGRRFSHKRTFIFAMKTKNKYHTLKFEFGSMLK